MKSFVLAFVAGVIFAVGLALSGMTQPEKVTGFLDIAGAWDPSLAFVMIGAIGVHFGLRRLIARRAAPVLARSFDEPPRAPIDGPLVAGAAIFGVGWGIAGYCPGPAVVSLGAGAVEAWAFVGAMVVGMWAHRAALDARVWAPKDGAHEAPLPDVHAVRGDVWGGDRG